LEDECHSRVSTVCEWMLVQSQRWKGQVYINMSKMWLYHIEITKCWEKGDRLRDILNLPILIYIYHPHTSKW
jgi:hypothetical protein